jgi:hypothetical protein
MYALADLEGMWSDSVVLTTIYSTSKTWSWGPSQNTVALPVRVRAFFGVPEPMKSQTPSTKLQTNLKFQYQMTTTGFES